MILTAALIQWLILATANTLFIHDSATALIQWVITGYGVDTMVGMG